MRPRDFLDLADELVIGNGEAEWRSAVSRAYYAAFHVAREFLQALGFAVPEAESAHKYLVYRINNAGDPQLAYIATRMDDLRRDRNIADYDLASFYPSHFAAKQVLRATDIIRVLEEYTAEPSRFAALAATITAYERDILREATFRNPTSP
jgi:uncharacterized protein (UPF0332 family)